MAARKSNKPTYNGIEFDSNEEMYFYWWIEELEKKGFLYDIRFQPKSFPLSNRKAMKYIKKLKTKTKDMEVTVMREHSYTCDFAFEFTDKAEKLFFIKYTEDPTTFEKKDIDSNLKSSFNSGVCFIEVKPSFDQNNMTRLAVLNQKWVLHQYETFINIIIPEKLFDKTFTPLRYLQCNKSSAKRKIKYKNITLLDDYIKNI